MVKIKRLFLAGCLFAFGIAVSYAVYRVYRQNCIQNQNLLHIANPPVIVELRETNLPIVSINTKGGLKSLSCGNSINSLVYIINNGEGQINYADTLQHTGQHFDFNGHAFIHCRGASSMLLDKKSFSIKLTTKKADNKVEKELLGMNKSDKWYLLAVHKDGTMMRDALTYELARPYFDFVPQIRFCEVLIDGKYQGVYLLTESVSNDRLGLKKSDRNDDELLGGYILEKDREETFKSKYLARDCSGNEIGNERVGFEIKFPKPQKLTSKQLQHIQNELAQMEDAIAGGNYAEYSKFIDVLSFASYQLVQEFSNNRDAYICSHKLYRPVGNTAMFKMVPWDFDIAYGNSPGRNGWYTDIIRYEADCEDQRLEPFWWNKLMQDATYCQIVKKRWQQFRNEAYSNANIEHKIDSLYRLLTLCHAINRNQSAWNVTKDTWLTRPLAFEESVCFLRLWIISRLDYMDAEILGIPSNETKRDSVYREIGKMILCKNYASTPVSDH